MRPALVILCYHRIVHDDDAGSWPYLERGTAVRAANFEKQLVDVTRVADLVGEAVALDVLARRRVLRRPAVWVTFDDGYRDTAYAATRVESATVFVTTNTSSHVLPADAWYGALLTASRRRGAIDIGLGPFDFDLSTPSGRARLVHGPERRAFLRASPAEQSTKLHELAQKLGARGAVVPPYLDESALRSLVRQGWTVGSHGHTHAPFDALEREDVVREAATSRETLSSLGPVRSIALPDGAPDRSGVLRELGYECVLGLGDAPCTADAEVQPRYLVPDDPGWVSRVLEPALGASADA